ncbi:MAG: zinc-binding dehydrogenase [Planctomycetota bacterium]
MRKVVIRRPGGDARLRVEEAPDPSPEADEVVAAVEAAGVNYADCTVRMGLYRSAKAYAGWPITPGFDVTGTVAGLGPRAGGPAAGTGVLAVTRFGGYASRVAVPRHQVFPLPDGLDAVLDASGVATLRQSYRHLAPTGRLVVYGFHSMMPRRGGRPNPRRLPFHYLRTPRFDPFRMTEQNRSVMAFNLSYLFDRRELLAEAMRRRLGWLERGRIRPPPVRRYPLERVADAHRDLESGATVGKLVPVF